MFQLIHIKGLIMSKTIKNITLLALFCGQILSAGQQQAIGYGVLKEIMNEAVYNQNNIEEFRLFVNAALSDVNKECADYAIDTPCTVQNDINFKITPEMDALDNKTDNSCNVGDSITISSGALTYTKLSSGKYNYKMRIDVSKIKLNGNNLPLHEVDTYRWSNSGIDKAISIDGNDSSLGSYNGNIAMTTINGLNTFIENAKVDINSSNSLDFKVKLQQYDKSKNGVKIDMTTKMTLNSEVDYFNILAKANDNGGYIKSTVKIPSLSEIYEEEETFNNNKQITSIRHKENGDNWSSGTVVPGSYDINESDISSNVKVKVTGTPTFTAPSTTYIVVKKDDTTNDSNIIGIGSFYDENGDSAIQTDELHFDYYGDTSYLAQSGATSDSDILDIYDMNDTNHPQKVNGIFLTK